MKKFQDNTLLVLFLIGFGIFVLYGQLHKEEKVEAEALPYLKITDEFKKDSMLYLLEDVAKEHSYLKYMRKFHRKEWAYLGDYGLSVNKNLVGVFISKDIGFHLIGFSKDSMLVKVGCSHTSWGGQPLYDEGYIPSIAVKEIDSLWWRHQQYMKELDKE